MFDNRSPSLARTLAGFITGSALATFGSAGAFLLFVGFPAPKSDHDHVQTAFVLIVLAAAIAGAVIGGRAFSSDFISETVPVVLGTLIFIGFLCLVSRLSLQESLSILGLISAGVLISSVGSFLVGQRFPPSANEDGP